MKKKPVAVLLILMIAVKETTALVVLTKVSDDVRDISEEVRLQEMPQQINIYIETSCKGPAVKKAAGAWFVECIKGSGELATRGGVLYADKVTENVLTLALVKSAFSIFTRPCQSRVFTECSHVLNTMKNGWIWQWRENNWVTAKGTMAKNAEAWKQCAEVVEGHKTDWTNGTHPYRIKMQSRLVKELSVKHDLPAAGIYVAVSVPEWNIG